MHITRVFLGLMVLHGCAGAPERERARAPACPPVPECPPGDPAVRYREPEAEPAPVAEQQAPIPGSRATSLARLEADLDEDGVDEVIEVFDDGYLRIGEGSTGVHLHVPEPHEGGAWSGGLEVVDVRRGDGHREVLFWQVIPAIEDPPIEVFVYALRDGSVSQTEIPMVLPSSARPVIRGDGRIVAQHDWCNGERRRSREIEHRMARDRTIGFHHDHTDGSTEHCFQAACPFVYVGAEQPRLVGEILRNVIGVSAETEQSLPLPIDAIAPDGTLTVTLRELKPEITYLDAIFVRVDGRSVPPLGCEGPACSADAEYLTLSMGQSQTFVFDVGTGAREVELVARGYYDPISP